MSLRVRRRQEADQFFGIGDWQEQTGFALVDEKSELDIVTEEPSAIKRTSSMSKWAQAKLSPRSPSTKVEHSKFN